MDIRTALWKDYMLCFCNKSGGKFECSIECEIGRGSTCIVYEASYITNTGDKKLVRVKECYPFGEKITRLDSGALCAETESMARFEECKNKMTEDFKIENRLFYSDGLTDLVTNTFDIYSANNTIYIISAYLKDSALSEYKLQSLKSCIGIVRNAAAAIGKIHTRGYLYLDTKPENILIVDSASERIQLFDFDSLIPISTIENISDKTLRLSYSRGYAAPEQRSGNLKALGFYTDVYGIGALLFSLVFGRTPDASDCECGAEIDFSKMNYQGNYCDRLYFGLGDFFRNTLANYRFDRFPDMNAAVNALEELEKYADITQPYIVSTRLNRPTFFVGRDKELAALYSEYKNPDGNYFFVSGMGGIGKTALIKEFIFHYREEFDAVLYLNYNGSLKRLIADDSAVRVNTVSRIPEEDPDDYYLRKLNALKKIATGKNILAVIDNFDNMSDLELKNIIGSFHKTVFVTRSDVSALNYRQINILEIENRADLYSIFEHNLRRDLTEDDIQYPDNIIEKTSANTLVLELVAKQISGSFISLKQASELIDEHGFTRITPEKIEFARDENYFYGTMQAILSELFAVNKLSEKQTALLKIISVFKSNGIDARSLQGLCELTSLDEVNSLIDHGWANSENGKVYLHTVICEMVDGFDCSAEFRTLFDRVMRNLCGELKRGNDLDHTRYMIGLTDCVLSECDKYPGLRGRNYARLCYALIMSAPIDREDKILEKAEYLIHKTKYLTPLEIMDMHAVIVDMYEANSNFNSAESALIRARKFAEKTGDNFIIAQYFDMLADFYNKRYEYGDIKKCLKCCDSAMRFSRRSSNIQAVELLASSALFKAVVMMRNGITKPSELLSLLKIGGEFCGKSENKFTQINYELHMSRAWFCALVTCDRTRLEKCLRKAYKIVTKFYPSDLGTVVHIILPASRMYYDLLDNKTATELLNKGVEICRRHEELPYIRQQRELSEILREMAV